MASVSQSPWYCTARPTNFNLSPTKSKPRSLSYKTLKVSSSSSSNSEPSAPNSSNPPENSSEAEARIKLAFSKAKAYKELVKSNPTPKIVQNPVSEYTDTGSGNGGLSEEVPLSVRILMEKAKEYEIKQDVFVGGDGIGEKSEAFSVLENLPHSGTRKDGFVSEFTPVNNQEVTPSLKLAMEKAKEYKKNKGVTGSGKLVEDSQTISGLKGGDGSEKIVAKKEDPKISSIDFIGLDFADKKKSRGLPAGLNPITDPFQEGDFPEVEILVGDPSKFGTTTVSQPKSAEDGNPVVYEPKLSTWGASLKTTEEDDLDIYKPNVSTWGGSPSYKNISKTEGDFPEVEILVGDPSKFGTGRVSQPKSAEEDNHVVYKPKVSTWGASPSPRNISETKENFPEVEILVRDPSKFGAVRGSNPRTLEEDDPDVYKPKVSTWGGSPSHRNISKTKEDFPEVEILVGDPSKFGTGRVSQPKSAEEDNHVVYKPKVSTWGASPSPRNISETDENFPEVEILVGDPSKFGAVRGSNPKTTEEDNPDVYKPKVSTWGGSPSHRNISKTKGDFPEVEILVGDPSKFGTRRVSQPKSAEENNNVVYKPKVSTRGASPSPRNISETEENFPEVEIFVGDPSKFGAVRGSNPKTIEVNDLDVYKPKVSTWGGSPSHRNISKTKGDFPEVEILVADPSKFGSTTLSESKSTEEDDPDVYEPKYSTWGASPGTRNISKIEGDFPDVEILVGDPSKCGKSKVSKPKTTEEDDYEVYKPEVPTLGASPSPTNILKTKGDFPEAEILVGSRTKFGTVTVSKPKTTEEDDPDIYIPKVSSWGVFPRPRNISKAYGGGRTIRPGEVLETAEVQAAKDARTRELVAAYRRKRDSSIDPKLKSECEEALKDGDSLMDIGKLKEALPFYEAVMDKITFQTELHGLAALHWAICQDSLTRHKEARIMYLKLKSHSNVNVKRTAKHFSFSFEAMAMMNVKSTTLAPINLGYQNYFEAFAEDKADYSPKDAEVEEGALNQVLPYMFFLVSPIFIVLLIALQKRI
ncbi:uncharacterized protein LOC131334731 [Rhododendron vialii]|uniref:uncharacterized protein LOC131334731 n=1 Tax=Rhododendron vialii TaxID=182163 RepID=UPI00265E2F01|nr:uncharacterized protein LOC131334731 [Rhododendron vialii]